MAVAGIARKLATIFNTKPSPLILTAQDQVSARSNLYAAPCDAMSYNGIQLNGTHDISQELGATAKVGNGYVLDGWLQYSSTGQFTGSQVDGSASVGFTNGIWCRITTAVTLTDPAAILVYTLIEGFRTSRLMWGTPNAKPLTVAFWATSARGGVYPFIVKNGAQNRGYAVLLNLTGGNVFQFFTITIPGDTTGTWDKFNGVGLSAMFSLGCTPTWQAASPNAWTNGNINGCVGQGTFNTTSDWIQIFGFFAFAGNEAPAQDRLPYIGRPADQEVEMCRRYYELFGSGLMGQWQTTTNLQLIGRFLRRKRATPTLGIVPGGNWSAEVVNVGTSSGSGAQLMNAQFDDTGGRFSLSQLSGGAVGADGSLMSNTFTVDARL